MIVTVEMIVVVTMVMVPQSLLLFVAGVRRPEQLPSPDGTSQTTPTHGQLVSYTG